VEVGRVVLEYMEVYSMSLNTEGGNRNLRSYCFADCHRVKLGPLVGSVVEEFVGNLEVG
jgi:hypothetical protein